MSCHLLPANLNAPSARIGTYTHLEMGKGEDMREALWRFLPACLIAVGLAVLLTPVAWTVGVDDNTLAYWKFDEGAGETAADSSPNGNDGSIEDAEWVAGIAGGGLSFDGDSARVVVPDNASLHPDSGDITIEAWINVASSPASWGDAGPMAFKQDAYQWNVNANGALWFGIWGARLESIGTYNFEEHLNEWHHATVTFEGGSQKTEIYVDGELNVEGTVAEAVDATGSTLYIGFKEDGGSYFHGFIDEVRISDVVRTQEEIRAMMTDNLAVSLRGKLPALWGMLKME